MKIDFTMKDLIKSGAHFGHIREKFNPKMQSFVFGLREGIYLIDLEKTAINLSLALDFLKTCKDEGKNVLFVSTKNGINSMVREVAEKVNMPYMCFRWPGGMLTNFSTIKKQIEKLRKLEERKTLDSWNDLTKRERLTIDREIAKLNKSFEGVKNLTKAPDAIFILDTMKEKTALEEARVLKVPIISLVDTNSDPTGIAYPIPINDDAKEAIALILGEVEKALK